MSNTFSCNFIPQWTHALHLFWYMCACVPAIGEDLDPYTWLQYPMPCHHAISRHGDMEWMVTVPVSCMNKLFFKVTLLCEQDKITRTFSHMRMPSAGTKLMWKDIKFPCWYCINCWIIKLLRTWWFKSWVHCVCGTCKNEYYQVYAYRITPLYIQTGWTYI